MRAPLSQMQKAAERFLNAHAGLQCPPDRLPALLLVCAEMLGRKFALADVDAQDLALSVWSDMSGRQTRCRFSIELSSPYLLFIEDHVAGTRRPVPLADLVRLLGPRLVHDADAAAPRG